MSVSLPSSRAIDLSWVEAQRDALTQDSSVRVSTNAAADTDVEKLSVNHAVRNTITTTVSHMVPDAAITNQRKSGRCWIFAGLNVLRARMIKDLSLEGLELSQNYLFFYDKLEKAGTFLAQVIEDAAEPFSAEHVRRTFSEPIPDGGYWAEFVSLVKKYGMVPSFAMPDTESARNSSSMNTHLATRLRRAGLELRAAVAAGEDPEPVRVQALADICRMLTIHLGVPPTEFSWQYRTKDKDFVREGTLTPLEFAQRYAADVEEYVVLAHDPRPTTPLNTKFVIDRTVTMVGRDPEYFLTTTAEVMKQASISAIRDGEPVWFACDVRKQSDLSSGTWDVALHDYDDFYGVDLSMSMEEALLSGESGPTHAMCFTGVDLVDDSPQHWRVENSWGDENGEKGFWTMKDSWFDNWVYEVIVHSSRLPQELRDAMSSEPTILPYWDPMA